MALRSPTITPSDTAGSGAHPAPAAVRAPLHHQATATATDILWLVIAILLSLASRVPFLTIPMIHDEGGYAYAARGWLEGTGRLYDDLWISRPQGIFALYALVFETLGTSVLALRFTAWLFAALTVYAVWLFGRRWTSPRVANLAAILTALLLSWPSFEGFTANAEVFMGMPAAFAAFWMLRMAQARWSAAQLVGVGALIGLSTVLKPSGIVMLPVAWAALWVVDDATRRERMRRAAWVLLGVGIVGAVTFIHGYFLGWDNFFYATVTYRLTLQSSATVPLSRHLWAIGSLTYHSASLVGMLLMIWAFRARMPLRAVLEADVAPRRRLLRPRRPAHPGGLLLVAWAIGAVAGLAMGGDWWPHYMIQLVPPVSLWLAWNIDGILHALRRWRLALATAMVTALVLLPFTMIAGGRDGLLTALYDHPGYPAQAEVAAYIRAHTDPDDTIYVAFDQASIYYLSDRKPAYRHLYDQELRALSESYADIIGIISGPDRPVYIISTLHPGPFPDDSRAFWREVGQYYDLETTIDGVPIYRAKDAPPQ